MAIKTFTAGSVLTASDTNTFLANAGLVWLNTTTFSNEASKSIDNVFSSTYTNYRIVVQLYGQTNSNIVRMTLITTGGTERTAGYFGQAWGVDPSASTTLYTTGSSTANLPLGYAGNQSATKFPLSAGVDVFNPISADTLTTIAGTFTGVNAGVVIFGGNVTGLYNSAEGHRGFWIRCSANTGLYGTVSTYGYRIS